MNLFQPRNLYGVIGAMLALVALFLVLNNGPNANTLLGTVGTQGRRILKVLQGR